MRQGTLRKAGALALAWCCLTQGSAVPLAASEMSAVQDRRVGNRLRIIPANHRDTVSLNAPKRDWQAVDEPSRYGDQQLPPPRFEPSLNAAPSPDGVRSAPPQEYESVPSRESVPALGRTPSGADRDEPHLPDANSLVPGNDLQRAPQDIESNLGELLPGSAPRRSTNTARVQLPAPNEMAFPVQQPLRDAQPSRPGMQPLDPLDRPGYPGPLDCADLDRFYDPTVFNTIGIDISVKGESPPHCPLPEEAIFPDFAVDVYHRNWACLTYTWKASAICHKPLYFEERSVERYGHSWGIAQPLVSGAHFFGSIAVLPYKMGVHPPGECIYPLGYYRPGSCAPKMWYQAPLSLRGALVQGGVVTGLVFLLP